MIDTGGPAMNRSLLRGRLGLGLGILAVVVAFTAFFLFGPWPGRAAPGLEGDYLVTWPRLGYLRIAADPSGAPRIKNRGESILGFYLPFGGNEMRLERRGSGYVLMLAFGSENGFVINSMPTHPKGPSEVWAEMYRLDPSQTTPGDWDLTLASNEKNGPIDPPMPSMLHRITDPAIITWIDQAHALRAPQGGLLQSLENNPAGAELLAGARAIVARAPDDLQLRPLLWHALTLVRDWPALEAELESVRPRLPALGGLAWMARLTENNLAAARLSAAGRNAWDVVRGWELGEGRHAPLDQVTEEWPKFLTCTAFVQPQLLVGENVPNFLGIQTAVKVRNVENFFLLLQGRREEALRYMACSFRLGQQMNDPEVLTLITKLIGVAVKAIAAGNLEFYALNCLDSPADYEALVTQLEALNATERADAMDHPLSSEPISALTTGDPSRLSRANFLEARTRGRVATAKFQIVRAVAGARGYQLMAGRLPASDAELATMFKGPLPGDPFTSAPLKLAPIEGGIACYSLGPDETDDRGALRYDPTNGSTSAGDLLAAVPERPACPIPRGGVRAETRQELAAQLPGGLPVDPFADTRGRPLSLTATSPMVVLSFGPDTDEKMPLENGRSRTPADPPEVSYDPSNGTTSNGDLWMTIPRRQEPE